MSEKILVPVLGESITEATVAKWLKSKGDSIKIDEPIVELETDKVNLEVPSAVNGILTEINAKDGDVVKVGSVLGSINEHDNKSTEEEIEKIEPKNMGAWFSVRDYIQWTLDYIGVSNNRIDYIGRKPAASPATGYAKRHLSQQKEIIDEVFK